MTTPLLSIVIPAYNEEKRLSNTLNKISTFLDKQDYSAEIVVVENGSSDRTLELANEFKKQVSYLRVFHEDQNGKGRAVKRGMLEAKGDYRFICDADLSMPIEEVNNFIPPVLEDVEISIASREAPGAVRYNEPEYRHFVGRVFNTLVRILALPGLHDSQCGFKCVRGDIAEEIFPFIKIYGWAFDVEMLFIARKRGYKIQEVPIPWYYQDQSKINVLSDSFKMLTDLLQIRWNSVRGLYSEK